MVQKQGNSETFYNMNEPWGHYYWHFTGGHKDVVRHSTVHKTVSQQQIIIHPKMLIMPRFRNLAPEELLIPMCKGQPMAFTIKLGNNWRLTWCLWMNSSCGQEIRYNVQFLWPKHKEDTFLILTIDSTMNLPEQIIMNSCLADWVLQRCPFSAILNSQLQETIAKVKIQGRSDKSKEKWNGKWIFHFSQPSFSLGIGREWHGGASLNWQEGRERGKREGKRKKERRQVFCRLFFHISVSFSSFVRFLFPSWILPFGGGWKIL